MAFMAILSMKTHFQFQSLVCEKWGFLQVINVNHILVPPELHFYLPLNHEFNVILLLFSLDSVQEFLCFHNIPVLVWNTVNDSESYVRASAIHLIGSLACQSQLWTCLLQNSQISEVFLKNFFCQSKSPPLRSN